MIRTVEWRNGTVVMIDQRVLPRQTVFNEYDDYRDVAGVKVPFKWTVTWLDGRDSIELSEVRANVVIEAARFGRPLPPRP